MPTTITRLAVQERVKDQLHPVQLAPRPAARPPATDQPRGAPVAVRRTLRIANCLAARPLQSTQPGKRQEELTRLKLKVMGLVTSIALRKAMGAGVARTPRMVALAVSVLAFAVAPAAAADFTWSGQAPSVDPSWSTASNWLADSAPSGSVGKLTFPLLTSAACTAMPPTAACYRSNNDVTGLNVTGITIDDAGPYLLTGNAITLGAGGLTASTTASDVHISPTLSLPVTLAASQTWSIDGHGASAGLGVSGDVSGSAANMLDIRLSHDGSMALADNDVEVGPVTISGGDPARDPSTNGAVGITNAELNATDGSPIHLTHTAISTTASATVGSLTSTAAQFKQQGILNVNGALTLDDASEVIMSLRPRPTGGIIDVRLNATGPIDLAGAHLTLLSSNACSALHPGDVHTLVTASGTLMGTFAGIPDGTTVATLCESSAASILRINYTAHAVTATVGAIDTTPPTITITTPRPGQHVTQGQTFASAFTCSDGSGSDVASCVGPSRLDTSTPGTKTFTVTTSDHAGNHASKSVDYVVDAPGSGSTPGGPTPLDDATPTTAVDVVSFATSPKSVQVSKAGSFKYVFAATALRTGKVALRTTKRVKIGSKRRFLRLSATFTASPAGIAAARFKLSRKNLRALKRARRLRFIVTVALGGRTFSTNLTLKAPNKT